MAALTIPLLHHPPPGDPAVPDHDAAPRPHDGRPQRLRSVLSIPPPFPSSSSPPLPLYFSISPPPPLLPRQVHGLAGAPEGPGAPGGVEGVSHVIDPKDPGLVTSSPAARVLLLLTSPPPPLLLSFPPLLLSLPPLNKEDLYGVLDPNTREWTDGPSTHILRFLHFLPSGFVFPWIC